MSRSTHVSDIDYLTAFGSGSGIVSERVWSDGRGRRRIVRSGAAIKAATASIAAESATTTKAAATKSTAVTATHTTETTAAAKAHTAATAGIPIFANFEHPTLPVIAVKLLDGVAGIVRALKYDNTGALRSAVRCHVNVGTNDAACACCGEVVSFRCPLDLTRVRRIILTSLPKQILEVLPADVEGKLDEG